MSGSRDTEPQLSAAEEGLVELGRLIRSARESVRMSQSQLAEHAGISAGYVRQLESARNPKTNKPTRPSPDVLAALSEVLKLDAAHSFGLAGLQVSEEHTAQSKRVSAARGATSEAIKSIQAALDSASDRGEFMSLQMRTRLRKFALEMARMGQGQLRVEAEHEPELAAEAARLCKNDFRAVSFQDEDWWSGEDGADYLEQQAQLLARGVTITRVFLFSDDAKLADYRKTFQQHLDLGIDAYVLRTSDVSRLLHSDMVIYDEDLLRRAMGSDIAGGGKVAEFIDDAATVSQAIFDFNELLDIVEHRASAHLRFVLDGLPAVQQ